VLELVVLAVDPRRLLMSILFLHFL
jgi:hypothetical protein